MLERQLRPDHPEFLNAGTAALAHAPAALLHRDMRPFLPLPLHAATDLASALASQGAHAGAAELLSRVHESRLRSQGPAHPETLATAHNLAVALLRQVRMQRDRLQGNGRRSRSYVLRGVLPSQAASVGPSGAAALLRQAEAALEEAIRSFTSTLGSGHLQASVTVASVHRCLGAPSHVDSPARAPVQTLAAMRTAAAVFLQQGRLREAEGMLRQLLAQAHAARIDASHAVVLQVRVVSDDGRGWTALTGTAIGSSCSCTAGRALRALPFSIPIALRSQTSLALADVLARVASAEAPMAPPLRLEETQALLEAALRTLKSQVRAGPASPHTRCALTPLSKQSRVDVAAVGSATASLDAVRQMLDHRRREAAAAHAAVAAVAPPRLLPHPLHHGPPWQQVMLVPIAAPPLPPARAMVQPWQPAARTANPPVQTTVGGVPPRSVALHGAPSIVPPAHPGPASHMAPPGVQSIRAAVDAREPADAMHPSLRCIVDMGFDPGRAHAALCSTHGDVERALVLLLAAPS